MKVRVKEEYPLKQGLKLSRFMLFKPDPNQVKEEYPLKQGLKLSSTQYCSCTAFSVKEEYPLKQGLKLVRFIISIIIRYC